MTLLILILSGCSSDRQPLQLGGKQSPENRIIAQRVAELAKAAEIPVDTRIGRGSTRLTLEAFNLETAVGRPLGCVPRA